MKWLTIPEAKGAATKSKRAAIASSKKHWKQNCTATETALKRKAKRLNSPCNAATCALCQRYVLPDGKRREDCKDCPLGPTMCCGEYDQARAAYDSWNRNKTKANFSTWQKKAKLMYERLCNL